MLRIKDALFKEDELEIKRGCNGNMVFKTIMCCEKRPDTLTTVLINKEDAKKIIEILEEYIKEE